MRPDSPRPKAINNIRLWNDLIYTLSLSNLTVSWQRKETRDRTAVTPIEKTDGRKKGLKNGTNQVVWSHSLDNPIPASQEGCLVVTEPSGKPSNTSQKPHWRGLWDLIMDIKIVYLYLWAPECWLKVRVVRFSINHYFPYQFVLFLDILGL